MRDYNVFMFDLAFKNRDFRMNPENQNTSGNRRQKADVLPLHLGMCYHTALQKRVNLV
jgi:hypothetical protein